MNLSRVSDSLGGKAALWELFSSNPPSLNLYVTLCAACPYLAGILTSNPGMIDELMDSLLVEQLPDLPLLEASLAELSRGAEDLEPILHSFKNAQHLRVGVRDMVGKDDVQVTHAALADVAEACLKQIAAAETRSSIEKFGLPTIGPLPEAASTPERPRAVVAAAARADVGDAVRAGRAGPRQARRPRAELSQRSRPGLPVRGRRRSTGRRSRARRLDQQQPLLQRARPADHQAANQFGPHGRLYEVDPRLRPTGRSGALAMPLVGVRPLLPRRATANFGSGWRCARRA